MLKELSSSQLLEYRKILKIVLDGLDKAYSVRQGLLDYNSASKYEHAQYDSLYDPEPYYHLKLFDKAIGIVRLYNPREWSVDDPEKKYFHFGIRVYNFSLYEDFNLSVKRTREYSTYGDFLDINDCLEYFYKFLKQIFIKVINVPQSDFYKWEIF